MDYCNGKATVIVVNDNYRLAPWADILYACDPQWWNWHSDMAFEGRKVSQYQIKPDGTKDPVDALRVTGVEYIRSLPNPGLSSEKGLIHQGQNSGYQAINLAYLEGATKIILLGYDMKRTEGKAHWFGDHRNAQPSQYESFLANYQSIPPQLADLGLEIINCTRSTALTCFPQKELHDVI